MSAEFQRVQERIKAFDFSGLFTQELMWNHYPSRPLQVPVDGVTYELTPIAQRGMAVFLCIPPKDAAFPKYAARRKIDNIVGKTAREHIIIFQDPAKSVQVWQWVRREAGKPSAVRQQIYYAGQSGDGLVHKIQAIAFGIEDEANVADTVARVGAAFDVEKVTKRFYEAFKGEHDELLRFTDGIPDAAMKRWYASVMLNRLMFIYFIQKKRFIAGDPDYLSHRLADSKKRGKDRFYRDFLCPLFFEGFAKPVGQRDPQMTKPLGTVPYLNGSLFLKHQIEELYGKQIDIPDAAFDRLLAYFERYDWHLDDRPTKTGREINPDVLGYVFEKYINQKEMGAYYSKEDITQYICKNTIIPSLFHHAYEGCRVAFEGKHSIWKLLQADPDRYLHASMLHGLDKKFPDAISAGIADVSKRKAWHKAASAEYALPTETWQEVVARRTRMVEVRRVVAAGEVQSINDLIRLNLDMCRFAEEVISNAEGPELVRAFYRGLHHLSVLDPACGSGAFLFAALNMLERLYDACLMRMQAFVDDLARSPEEKDQNKYADFRKILDEMNDKARHPSPRYFVLKSLILNNLYGVDIMEEATEICKLRLFLKLVAQISPGETIEPLPDIDFNIRAGNGLVGFASQDELDEIFVTKFDLGNKKEDIKSRMELADRAYERFRHMQTDEEASPTDLATAKAEVKARQAELAAELDAYIGEEYGVKKGDKHLAAFKATHQPFHWLAAFYGIMKAGGFDAIIGNPPYVEYKNIKSRYTLLPSFEPYSTNLYAAFCYRSDTLKSPQGFVSLIVPVALPSTDRMQPVRQLLSKRHTVYYTSFSTRPDKLFDAAEQRLTIYIQCPAAEPKLLSGGYLKWYSEERPFLFDRIHYVEAPAMSERNNIWPKVCGEIEAAVFARLRNLKRLMQGRVLGGSDFLYYKNTGLRYFNTVTLEAPKCWINGKKASSSRETLLKVLPKYKGAVHAYLISSMFFFYWQATSNCRDLNPSDITLAPYPNLDDSLDKLIKLSAEAESDYRAKGKIITMNNKKTGKVEIESLTPANSKAIIDKIDSVLGADAGLDPELTYYIINHDLKYRMGADEDLGEAV